jgi:nitrous oxidase accessory protein NosD
MVNNKSLTVKGDPSAETVLSGELEQALVIVGEGGRLVLENITLQGTGKTEVGIFIDKGSAQVTGCRAQGLSIKLFYVQSGDLSIEQCHFKQLGSVAVTALAQSDLKVTNSSFEDITEYVIGVQQAKSVEVRGNSFKKISQVLLLQQGNPTVKITDNIISEVESKEHVLWVGAGDEIIISGNTIFNVGGGVLLRGEFGKTAEVSGNTFADCKAGSVYIEATGKGDDGGVNISKNRIINSGDYGILLIEALKTGLSDNIIIVKDGTGVAIQSASFARMNENIISGSESGVYVHETAGKESTVGNDILIGGIYPQAIQLNSAEGRKIDFLLGVSDTKDKFSRMIEAVSASVKPEDFPAFEELSRNIASLTEEARKLRAQVDSISGVTVSARDSIGQVHSIDFRVFDAEDKLISENNRDNPKATLMAGTYFIETDIGEGKRREVKLEEGREEKVIVENKDMIFLTRVRTGGDGVAIQTILPVGLRKKNIIQAIVKDKNKAGRHAVRRRGITQGQLESAVSAALKALPEIAKMYKKAGDEQQALLNEGDFQSDAFKKTTIELGMLNSAAGWVCDILALGGRPEDAETLIKMAGGEIEFRRKLVRTAVEIENRLGGIASGAVVKVLDKDSTEHEKKCAFFAAEILYCYGYTRGENLLLKQLETRSNKTETGTAAYVLSGSGNPGVTEAMRKLLKTFLDEKEQVDIKSGTISENYPSYYIRSAAESAMLHLLAYGDENDLRQIAKLPFNNNYIEALFPLVSNPQDILKALIGTRYDISTAARLYPALETRPAAEYKELHDQLVNTLVTNHMPYLEPFIRQYRYGRIRVDGALNPKISFCWPNQIVADRVRERDDEYLNKYLTWIPRPWAIDSMVKNFSEKKYSSAKYLDYLSHKDLLEVFEKAGLGQDNTLFLDLYFKHHQTASRLFQVSHPFPRGTERRAFVLRHDTSPVGAVSGIMDIRPTWQEGSKLRFEITLRFATADEGGLAAMMSEGDPTIASFVGKTGDNLVSNVSLSRSGKEIAVKDMGVNDKGKLTFEADAGKRDFSELTLHLDIKLFEKTWPVDVALYASSFARASRQ